MNVGKLLRNGRCMILTYDHGLEHGPGEFTGNNADPEHVFDLALEGGFTAIACHIGIAEKYYYGPYRDIPLIVKVNGSTTMPHINPVAAQLCSVERALKAGASAIGFTIYDGSPNEPRMFEAFGKVCEQAHDYGLPVVAWMYPRGPGVREQSNEALAYAARIALELGADIIKVKYNGDEENLKWMTRLAGRAKVVISSGHRLSDIELLNEAKTAIGCGCIGIALGRAIWKHKKPYSLARAVKAVVLEEKPSLEAVQHLK